MAWHGSMMWPPCRRNVLADRGLASKRRWRAPQTKPKTCQVLTNLVSRANQNQHLHESRSNLVLRGRHARQVFTTKRTKVTKAEPRAAALRA